jgi:type I restriction enzyme, S subunit
MSEWEKFALGEVTINHDSRRVPVKGNERKAGPYPYYGASGVVDHVEGYLFDGAYLLIAEDGENLRTRSTPIAFMAYGKFWVNNHAHVVQGNRLADTRFLAYVLARTDISGYLSGSTQPKLTQSAMNQIEVRLPNRKYQEAIVATLGALDDKIAVNDRMSITTNSLLKMYFTESSNSAVREVKIGELVEFKYGKALKEGDRTPGLIPVFGGNGISGWNNISLSDGPGIIVGRKGANAGSVSWSEGPFWPIDTSFYVKPKGSVSLEFLLYLLKSADLRNFVGDSAIPGLNREIALSIPVRLPAGGMIQLFTETARPLLALEAQITEESRSLAELRDALLPRLMSGEIRVRDAEKVVEDVT